MADLLAQQFKYLLKMRKVFFSTLAVTSFVILSGQASATLINASFEDGFNDWLATGDPYIVTDTGSGRTRDSYVNYLGWDGADVWFSNSPEDGDKYAVFGSNGNESVGAITSTLWTAENQYLSFWHAGNNTSGLAESERAFAAIFDINGNELTRAVATSYNDSTWREFTLDLSAAGLNAGDKFQFYYQDGATWSVIDNISASGDALAQAVPEPSTYALLALAFLGLRANRRRTK
jgi:hypothetical protein